MGHVLLLDTTTIKTIFALIYVDIGVKPFKILPIYAQISVKWGATTLNVTTFGIITLSIMTLSMTTNKI